MPFLSIVMATVWSDLEVARLSAPRWLDPLGNHSTLSQGTVRIYDIRHEYDALRISHL
jgi:hypothetical protein